MSIDLHLHTTASDGKLTPAELLQAAAIAGVDILAVTDHDTTAGLDEAGAAADHLGVRLVSGIEISATREEADVHLLGYFFSRDHEGLQAFLRGLRAARVRRFRAIARQLAALGMPVDVEAMRGAFRSQTGVVGRRPAEDDSRTGDVPAADESKGGRSLGRPQLAEALVAAGYVSSSREAFDRYLGAGRPAYIARVAVEPERVIQLLHAAGGIVSLAHPGLLQRDDWIEALARQGLDAIEVYHSDHVPNATMRYRQLAGRLGLAVSGGSDFHASAVHGVHGARAPGSVALPPEAFDELEKRVRERQ